MAELGQYIGRIEASGASTRFTFQPLPNIGYPGDVEEIVYVPVVNFSGSLPDVPRDLGRSLRISVLSERPSGFTGRPEIPVTLSGNRNSVSQYRLAYFNINPENIINL